MPNTVTACVCVCICTMCVCSWVSARIVCACMWVCAWHMCEFTRGSERMCVWSSACFLMCVSQHCSPLSSNCGSMLKPSVCPEIVSEGEDVSWYCLQNLPNTSGNSSLFSDYCDLSFFYFVLFFIRTHGDMYLFLHLLTYCIIMLLSKPFGCHLV